MCLCLPFFFFPLTDLAASHHGGSTLMILWDPEFLLKTLPLKTIVRLRPSRLSPHNEENLYSNHSSDHCCGSFNIHCRHKYSLEWKKCLLGQWSLCNPVISSEIMSVTPVMRRLKIKALSESNKKRTVSYCIFKVVKLACEMAKPDELSSTP